MMGMATPFALRTSYLNIGEKAIKLNPRLTMKARFRASVRESDHSGGSSATAPTQKM